MVSSKIKCNYFTSVKLIDQNCFTFFPSGEELHITLWDGSAQEFDELALRNLPSPIIIAFAGFRVTEFKGNFNFHLIFFLKKKSFRFLLSF
jgi:hypothetical protein